MRISNRWRLVRGSRWAGRLIGLAAAGFLLLILIASAAGEMLTGGFQVVTIEAILLGLLAGIALAGSILP